MAPNASMSWGSMTWVDYLFLAPLVPVIASGALWFIPWEKYVPWRKIPLILIGAYLILAALSVRHFGFSIWFQGTFALVGVILSAVWIFRRLREPPA